MNLLNSLLVAVIVYMPYQQHYVFVSEQKGLNLINLMFIALLLGILLRKADPRHSTALSTPLKNRFTLLIAALVFAFLVAELRDSSNFLQDLGLLKDHIFYLLFFFLYYHAVRDMKGIRIMFAAILFAAFLVTLQGLRQALDYGIGSFAWHKRVTGPFGAGTFGGANQASAFYAMFVPMFFAILLIAKSRPLMRIACIPCVALGIFSTFFTYSRQAYVILFGQFLLLSMRRNLIAVLLLLVALFSFEEWAPQGVIERIEMTEHTDSQGEVKLDESTASRFLLWEGAMQLFTERPWGVGLGRFPRDIGTVVPSYGYFDAHNGYVLVTTEMGLLGILAMLWLFTGLVSLARQIAKLDVTEDTQLLATAYLSAVIGAICVNFFGSRIFDGPVMGNFWILSGLAARYLTLEREKRVSARTEATLASTGAVVSESDRLIASRNS